MSLAWMDGRRTAGSMLLPPGGPWMAAPDGRGYALVFNLGSGGGAGEVYDVRPGGYRRIDGSVAAVGPTRWLIVRCHRRRHCSNVVIDPATGARRTLPGRPAQAGQAPGVIAPDGIAAAIFRSAVGKVTVHLVNLESGADRRITLQVDQGSANEQTLAWSPDSRWLFAAAADGRLAVVSARTGQVRGIGVALPPVSQIVIRAGRMEP
jgi:WD40 repeat protein